jgi:predicted cupin superfamily sugar epimerase
MSAQEIRELLKLEPLPGEGGYYRRTYEASGIIPARDLPKHEGPRVYSTAIYYLITPDSYSALHRVPQDELFHFYLGDPVEMIQLSPAGVLTELVIGPDLGKGQRPQVVAPGGSWQGTRLMGQGKWALMGCTVAPGFELADFEIKKRAELIRMFPRHETLIRRFTYE